MDNERLQSELRACLWMMLRIEHGGPVLFGLERAIKREEAVRIQ